MRAQLDLWIVSVTRTALALAIFDKEIYPKVYDKYFSCSFILFCLIVVSIIVEIEAEKTSFDANALQAPLNCDHTKFACLPSARKNLAFAPVKLTCWTYSL